MGGGIGREAVLGGAVLGGSTVSLQQGQVEKAITIAQVGLCFGTRWATDPRPN